MIRLVEFAYDWDLAWPAHSAWCPRLRVVLPSATKERLEIRMILNARDRRHRHLLVKLRRWRSPVVHHPRRGYVRGVDMMHRVLWRERMVVHLLVVERDALRWRGVVPHAWVARVWSGRGRANEVRRRWRGAVDHCGGGGVHCRWGGDGVGGRVVVRVMVVVVVCGCLDVLALTLPLPVADVPRVTRVAVEREGAVDRGRPAVLDRHYAVRCQSR
ncbi:hypothetical protein CALVIDRAFT_352939 [Calocera viscosa TUFC12733]|uniref:Uncharacterized protein n=1 Tax=Calocera viscosa (strain TUFC12733) TaxID=1330018 RepID=A0A167QBP5_CALVF|nr:hypothetical protein CALVIDRAFT_352939 [Calocera viscosa TUFC12733]